MPVSGSKPNSTTGGRPTSPGKHGAQRRSPISGTSISELLASAGADPDDDSTEGEMTDENAELQVDSRSAEKLEKVRAKILDFIRQRRPRFMQAFELMTFEENIIAVSVPTQELRDEILRSKTALLMRIAELAGTEGILELKVTVNEEMRVARPIKLEDRVRFLTEKNPQLAELRKALDLEIE